MLESLYEYYVEHCPLYEVLMYIFRADIFVTDILIGLLMSTVGIERGTFKY
jgi:hypothetical protein